MKKHIAVFMLCAVLCFCAAGCSTGSNGGNNENSGSQNQQKYYGHQLDGNNYDDFLIVTYTYQKEPHRGTEYIIDVTYFITVRSIDPSYTFETFTAYTNGTMYRNELCLIFYGKKCTLDSRGNGFLSVTHVVSTLTSIGAPKVQAAVGWVTWTAA